MSGRDEDDREHFDAWNGENLFRHVKAQHDKLLSDLQDESKRLQHEWTRENGGSGSADPFSAFKKFIDRGFSSLSHAIQHLPTNTAELTSSMQHAQARLRAEEQDISHRWTGSTDSPDHIQMGQARRTEREREEAVTSTGELLEIAQELNAHIPLANIEALYRDQESDMRVFDIIGGIPMISTLQPRWLSVDWFKRSHYSPVRLEAHPALGEHGAKWRAAFEDLLSASLGKPTGSVERVGMRTPFGRPQSTFYGPGLEWMLSLQCRGILPPQLPRTYSDPHAAMQATDAYLSRLLRDQSLHAMGRQMQHNSPDHALAADFDDLLAAVGTKATADTEADPLPVRTYPDAEQDLYESPYLFPGTGIKEYEADRASDKAQSGEMALDVRSKARDSASSVEQAVLQRGYELAEEDCGSFVSTLPTFEELLERVLHLEQEHNNIEQMTGNVPCGARDDGLVMTNNQTASSVASEKSQPGRVIVSEEVHIPEELWATYENGTYREKAAIVEKCRARSSAAAAKRTSHQAEYSVDTDSSAHMHYATKRPNVLSALTTTHTTRHPDGTVTTKVVLKQRFADGREETSESVHTRNEAANKQGEHQQPAQGGLKKSGWFWT